MSLIVMVIANPYNLASPFIFSFTVMLLYWTFKGLPAAVHVLFCALVQWSKHFFLICYSM